VTTIVDLVSAHPFLDGLAPHAYARLSTWARRSKYQAGERIFAEGGNAGQFWLILSGHVQLDAHLPGRGSLVIESLGHAAVLGWSWMFPPYVWHFGAMAVQPTDTIELDGIGVRQVCDADPALGYDLTRRFMQVVVDRLQATRIRLLDLYGSP
jgi:CRP/FNR family transcriptional regulator, cyclic AMP receptor protein